MQMRTRRTAWLAVGVLAATAGLAGCGGDPEPDPDRVVRVGLAQPQHLVPTNVDDQGGAQVLATLFTPLVAFDEQSRPYELAAESVEPSHGGRIWTVTLRDGYTFHNGEPVTADRYIDAWNYGADSANRQRNGYMFNRVEGYGDLNPRDGTDPTAFTMSGLAKVDDHTFTVTLAEPYREFRAVLGAAAFYPLPQAAFGEAGQLRKGFAEAPIGNGPFRMVGAWERDTRIEVERYKDFAGDPPAFGGVEFRFYPDPGQAYADLREGALDLATDIPAEHQSAAASELGDRFVRRPGSAFQYLAFPAHEQELADPDVRRAISMAIDREQIVGPQFQDAQFQDAQTPARSFVAPAVPGARDNTCGAACELDPATGRDLYQRAGGPDRLTITYNHDGGHADWLAAVCEQLRTNLGVACATEAEPTLTDLLTRVENGEPVGLVRLGWAMDHPSPASYLAPLYSTTGSANFSGYHNPEFDAALAAGLAATSPAEATSAYQQAEAILAEDLPVIPLRFGQHTAGHSPDVPKVTISPLGHTIFWR